MNKTKKTISDILTAVKYADEILHEGHGIKNTNNRPDIRNDRFIRKSNSKRDNKPYNKSTNKRGRNKFRGDRNDDDYNKYDKTRDRSRSRNHRYNKSRGRSKHRYRNRDYSSRRSTPTDNKHHKTKSKSIICFKCQQPGHYADKCPNKKKNDDNNKNPAQQQDKSKNKSKNKRSSHYFTARDSPPDYRRNLFDNNNNLDNIGRQVTFSDDDQASPPYNCKNRNILNSNVSNHYRRYIFVTNTINTTNTTNLDAPFTTKLKFNHYRSKETDGLYEALIDSGANTPAMSTEFVKSENFPIFAVKRPFVADTANGEVIIKYATVLDIENKNEGNNYWMKTIF